MHNYVTAIGFMDVYDTPYMDKIIKDYIEKSVENNVVKYVKKEPGKSRFITAELDMPLLSDCDGNHRGGIKIRGKYNSVTGSFYYTNCFPYVVSNYSYYAESVSITMKKDSEGYLGIVSGQVSELSPIFFVTNDIELISYNPEKSDFENVNVYFTGLALEGKIILPANLNNKPEQTDSDVNRGDLLGRALSGDRDAITELTMVDLDTYIDIGKRIKNEDVYSIVYSSMVPAGLESDMYSVVGNILEIDTLENDITGNYLYMLLIECNAMVFHVIIDSSTLLGEPEVGRRFVGSVWLQGKISID